MRTPYSLTILCTALSLSTSAQDLDAWCVPQDEGRFWSVADGVIQEWTVNGGTVTGGSVVLNGPVELNSLSFCSASGPTGFYANGTTGIQYYAGGAWTPVTILPSLFSNGGSGAHMYFVDLNNYLYHFTGTTATLIATPADGYWFAGDLVADTDGNAYVPYGPSGMGVPATEYRKYGPDGTLLQSWSANFIPTNGWGAFMLGNTIYIAFGPNNPTFPLKLVPFTLMGTAVVQGAPIPFLQGEMLDLASCTGSPLSSVEELLTTGALTIGPNPADERATITLGRAWNGSTDRITLVDMNGRTLEPRVEATAGGVALHVSELAAGAYQVRLTDADGGVRSGRLVVSHR